jgi:hypothetical protein
MYENKEGIEKRQYEKDYSHGFREDGQASKDAEKDRFSPFLKRFALQKKPVAECSQCGQRKLKEEVPREGDNRRKRGDAEDGKQSRCRTAEPAADEEDREQEDEQVDEIGQIGDIEVDSEEREKRYSGGGKERPEVWSLRDEGSQELRYPAVHERIIIIKGHIEIESGIPRRGHMREVVADPCVIDNRQEDGKTENKCYNNDGFFHLLG